MVVFKFFQVKSETEIQEFGWYLHPLFDRYKKYNLGEFRKKIYEYPLPKYYPIDYGQINPIDISLSFTLIANTNI